MMSARGLARHVRRQRRIDQDNNFLRTSSGDDFLAGPIFSAPRFFDGSARRAGGVYCRRRSSTSAVSVSAGSRMTGRQPGVPVGDDFLANPDFLGQADFLNPICRNSCGAADPSRRAGRRATGGRCRSGRQTSNQAGYFSSACSSSPAGGSMASIPARSRICELGLDHRRAGPFRLTRVW